MKKRILFLAPYSIPINNPEAICNSKLLKVLSEAGFLIDVISKNNNNAYTPDSLESLFVSKLMSVKIFFLENRITLRTVIDHIRVFFKTGYVYKGAHWAIYAIEEAERLIEKNKYDVIMSRNPASELVALYLSRKYNIKWLANWNDPYPDEFYPAPYGKGNKVKLNIMRCKLIKDIVKYADIHTFPAKRLRNYMISYMNIPVEKTKIIPHVCIDNLYPEKTEVSHSDKLRIIHSGNVSYPRSPETLLKAMAEFIQHTPMAQIEVSFIGKQDEDFMALVSKYNLNKYIRLLEPLDYLSNLQLMADFDLALLIEADLEEGIFFPTKIGDYLQSHLPIWTISPKQGELRDLYDKGHIEYFSEIASFQSVYSELVEIYTTFVNNGNTLPRKNILDDYLPSTILNTYFSLIN